MQFFQIVFADFHTSYLTADGLGKLGNKLNDSGVLIRCRMGLNVFLNLLLQSVRTLLPFYKNDGRFYDLTSDFIGNGSDCTFQNVRKLHDYAFDFKRADAVTGRLDNVINASYVPEVAVLVHARLVARVIITVMPNFICLVFVKIITDKQTAGNVLLGADADLAHIARLTFVSVGVKEYNVIEGAGSAH